MPLTITEIERVAAAADYYAVVAVGRGDGSVQASLVKAGIVTDPVSGTPGVGIVVAGSAKKLALLRKSRRASVVFSSGGQWACVEGPIRLVGPDDQPADASVDVAATLRAVFVAAGGSHDDWAEFDRVMADDRRCAVFVDLARSYSNG